MQPTAQAVGERSQQKESLKGRKKPNRQSSRARYNRLIVQKNQLYYGDNVWGSISYPPISGLEHRPREGTSLAVPLTQPPLTTGCPVENSCQAPSGPCFHLKY